MLLFSAVFIARYHLTRKRRFIHSFFLLEREIFVRNQESGQTGSMGSVEQATAQSAGIRHGWSARRHASRFRFDERLGDCANGSRFMQIHLGVLSNRRGPTTWHRAGLRWAVQQQTVSNQDSN